jgi:hypothetical protein
MNLLSHLIAPVQAVVLFFAPHAGTFKPSPARHLARHPVRPMTVSTANATARITYPSRTSRITSRISAHPIHSVRVVRNVDNTLPADRAGRMVVSGRFADVCAELERLAGTDMRTA